MENRILIILMGLVSALYTFADEKKSSVTSTLVSLLKFLYPMV